MDSAPAPLSSQEKVLTLVGTLLAMFLAALDQTVVATAGPDMQKSLAMEPALYTWITTAYLVAATVLVPVYGKLSDLFGRKRILLVGVVVFLAGSVACGLSQSAAQLIAFRALQGVGAASLFTSAFAVIGDLFPPAERGKYTGLFGAVFGVSSLVGPLLGGFITDTWGWHWVFFINLPIGGLALTFIVLRMPALRRPGVSGGAVDVLGAVLLAAAVIPFLLAASFGRPEVLPGDFGYRWTSWQILSLLAASALGAVAFVAWELKAKEPLVELRLFRAPVMAWGSATMFVLGAAFLTPMVFLPLFMVNVVGVTNTASGLTISPLVLGIVAGNVLAGQLVARLGKYKPLMLGALVLLCVGFAIMGFTLTADSTQAEVTAKMVLVGLGMGPSIPLYTLAIQNAVDVQHLGVATSMSTFARQMGSTFGIAVAGSLFATTLSSTLAERLQAATAGLPPALVQRYAPRSAGGGAGEGGPGAGQAFDAAALKARIDEQLDGARSVAAKALRGDSLAVALVAASDFADDRLRQAAEAGGVAKLVEASFQGVRAKVHAAAQSPQAWAELSASRELPEEVASAVRQVPADAFAQDASRGAALAQLEAAVTAAEARAKERALAQALADVDQRIAQYKPTLFGVVDAVARALKEAFTLAVRRVYVVALVLAALALLLTLRLPQLPLRKGGGAGGHVVEP